MLPALNSVAQSDTHTLETESTSSLGGHPSGVKGSPLASSASARCSDSRHIANQTETHCSQLKETSLQAEQSSAAPEMVTASRMPTTPRVVVTGHSVSSHEESRLDSSSLSETAEPLVFNLHSYLTGQPPEAQIPGECIASFSRQPELLNSEQTSEQTSRLAPVNRSVEQSRGRFETPMTFQLSQSQMKRLREMQTEYKLNSHTTSRLHEKTIRDRLKFADWNRLYCDKTGVYRPCILISQPEMYKVRLVFRCDLAKIDECMREDNTFLARVNLDTIGQLKQSNRLKAYTESFVDTEADWTAAAPLLLQANSKQTIAPLSSVPENHRLNGWTDTPETLNVKRDWCPTGNSVCRLLHAEDIGSRWVEIVTARRKQHKKRSGVRDRARKKAAGNADRIWLTNRMAAIKKMSTESTRVRELHDESQAAKVNDLSLIHI